MKYKKFIITTIILILSVSFAIQIPVSGATEDRILKWANNERVDTYNPLSTIFRCAVTLHENMYDSLVVLSGIPPEVTPWLATSWEFSPNGETCDVEIDRNAKWHDGEDLTAEDVKFTYEYVLATGGGLYYTSVENIEKVDVLEPYKVRFKFIEAPPENMVLKMIFKIPILPKHIWENIPAEEALQLDPSVEHLIGSGPMIFYSGDKEVTKMVANDEYFKGRPQIDEMMSVYYPNLDTAAAALITGEIDAIWGVLPERTALALDDEENIKVFKDPSFYFRSIYINVWEETTGGHPALKDHNVRLAMQHAVDQDYLIQTVHMGLADYIPTMVCDLFGEYYNPNVIDERYEFDLDLSNNILDEAGYMDTNNDGIRETPDGDLELEFKFDVVSDIPEELRAAEIISDWFSEIGIALNIRSLESTTMLSEWFPPQSDLGVWFWGAMVPDPTMRLYIYITDAIENQWSDTGWSNERYDELYYQQLTEVDNEKRIEMVWEMQEIYYDAAVEIMLYRTRAFSATRTDTFTGYVSGVDGIFNSMNKDTVLNVNPVSAGEPEPEPEEESGWIPGFPIGAVALGAMIGVFVLFAMNKQN